MPIRLEMILGNFRLIGKRQTAARCLFTNSNELATGNWQPDANSVSEDFRHYEVNRKSANGSQLPIRIFL